MQRAGGDPVIAHEIQLRSWPGKPVLGKVDAMFCQPSCLITRTGLISMSAGKKPAYHTRSCDSPRWQDRHVWTHVSIMITRRDTVRKVRMSEDGHNNTARVVGFLVA